MLGRPPWLGRTPGISQDLCSCCQDQVPCCQDLSAMLSGLSHHVVDRVREASCVGRPPGVSIMLFQPTVLLIMSRRPPGHGRTPGISSCCQDLCSCWQNQAPCCQDLSAMLSGPYHHVVDHVGEASLAWEDSWH